MLAKYYGVFKHCFHLSYRSIYYFVSVGFYWDDRNVLHNSGTWSTVVVVTDNIFVVIFLDFNNWNLVIVCSHFFRVEGEASNLSLVLSIQVPLSSRAALHFSKKCTCFI